MADRKQFENIPQADPELQRILREARTANEDELHEQRISFAFGNAPFDDENISKDSVRHVSMRLKLSD